MQMQRIQEGPLSADLDRYIGGVRFPILKHDVVHAVRQNEAPDEVVARLESVLVTEFRDRDHLMEAYRSSLEEDRLSS
jgi:hypothetical protein